MIDLDEAILSLNITWELDPAETKRLDRDIKSAEAYVADFAGYPIKETDTVAKQLMLDCLRYIRNDVLAEFQKNYSEDLIMLRNKYRIENELSD